MPKITSEPNSSTPTRKFTIEETSRVRMIWMRRYHTREQLLKKSVTLDAEPR